MSARMRATHRAAKAMSLFVLAFVIQWWAMALFGAWQLATTKEVPQAIHHLVTTFSNIGGCLNLGVFFLIHRKRLSMGERDATENAITSLSTRRSAETSSDPTETFTRVTINYLKLIKCLLIKARKERKC